MLVNVSKRLPRYMFNRIACARERIDHVDVTTISAKRINSAATLGRSRCVKRSLRKRKARSRMEVFESSSRPFLPLLLRDNVCMPN